MALFPAEGGLGGLHLGLEALTGFATLNLLLPLAVVNVALVYSRRKFPEIERGFRVPGVPLVPALGVIANLALIYNLPRIGVVTGLVLTATLIVAYLLWGGAPTSRRYSSGSRNRPARRARTAATRIVVLWVPTERVRDRRTVALTETGRQTAFGCSSRSPAPIGQ